MRIEGKRVVITGGSSGIGLALAHEAAAKGGRLLLCSRGLDRLYAAQEMIHDRFPCTPRPIVAQCDVSCRDSVRKMVQAALEQLGGLDILVNNAGICVYGNSERTRPQDYQSVMAVNFYGPVNCMMETIPTMKCQREGLIVNVSSLAAIHGVPYLAAYSASKAALVALSESVRAELTDSGVRVLNVYPGYTDTGIFAAEKKLGGAKRPEGTYRSPCKVARAVIRAIEGGKNDLIISTQGKLMAFLSGTAPHLLAKEMARMAHLLRQEETVSNA